MMKKIIKSKGQVPFAFGLLISPNSEPDYQFAKFSVPLADCSKKKRTYNPKKGCKDLTQRREGVEKARKENHFKKREHYPLRLSWLFLASLR